jgi:hypothetical protein
VPVIGRRRGPTVVARRSVAVIALTGLVAGCGVGTGTLRIDDAEEAIVRAAEAVVDRVGLDLGSPVVPGTREQCELRSGGAGLRNRVRVSAPVTDRTAAFDLAAAALVSEGFLVVDSGVPGTLLAQRDGMSITVGAEPGGLALDALTGCRPR